MSLEFTRVCDVCGKEIKHRMLHSDVTLSAKFHNKGITDRFNGDLCADCTKKLKRFLYGKEMKEDE